VILVIVQLFAPYRGWMILAVGLGASWMFSYWWAVNLGRNVRLMREMRYGYAQVGDRFEERFTLFNTGPIPVIWAEVRDHSSFPGYQASQVRAVAANSTARWLLSTVCRQRGIYELGPTTIYLGDPIGMYTVEIHYPAASSILVTPPILPLPAIHIAPGGRSGSGRPRPNAPDRTVSASTIREFSPGDPLRWIHWPTTARKGSLFVRQFDGTPAGDWLLVLDQAAAVQAGEGADSTLEHGIILAASLAASGLRSGIPVGLVANGEPPIWLPPRLGGSQHWEILRALTLSKHGPEPLSQSLKQVKDVLNARASLIIITPDMSEWMDALIPLLWRGVVPTALLLDPVSFGDNRPAERAASVLADLQVRRYIIKRDLLDVPEARPGKKGSWEWLVTGTGKAFPIRQPTDLTWRRVL
jgi:uncharacterized protein (DUF58 family)